MSFTFKVPSYFVSECSCLFIVQEKANEYFNYEYQSSIKGSHIDFFLMLSKTINMHLSQPKR